MDDRETGISVAVNESPAVSDAVIDEIRKAAGKLRKALMDTQRADEELEKALWRGLRPCPPWNPENGRQD